MCGASGDIRRGIPRRCSALPGTGPGTDPSGDTVRILASTRYRHLIAEAGLDFHLLPADPTEMIESPEGQALLTGRSNPAWIHPPYGPTTTTHIMTMLEETKGRREEGADLVLAPTFGFLGVHLSQYLHVPHVIIHFQPSQPTKAFPHPFAPAARMLGAWGNRLSFEAVDIGSWLVCRKFINAWRRESLGLPELPLPALFRQARRAPVLCAFSPAVVPRPFDWRPNVHVTGYWYHEQPLWDTHRDSSTSWPPDLHPSTSDSAA